MVYLVSDRVLARRVMAGRTSPVRRLLGHVMCVSYALMYGAPAVQSLAPQIGWATRSWPWVATTRALVNSPTFKVLEAFSGGSRCTVPSISGASA